MNHLTMPCAEIIYNLTNNEIEKIKTKLENRNLSDEERNKLKEELQNHKFVFVSIREIIKKGIGYIHFFTKQVPIEDNNGDIELQLVGPDE